MRRNKANSVLACIMYRMVLLVNVGARLRGQSGDMSVECSGLIEEASNGVVAD